jgi:hypothetical protein
MPVNKPYRRICRQFSNGSYAEGGRSRYIEHPKYAKSPEHYIRAFTLLLKDMQELFDYIEPSDKNLSCYSYRIHELLLRACIEIEANCKAILVENGYIKSNDMKMGDYKKINVSHRLSSYEVRLPFWRGTHNIRKPFLSWAIGNNLRWYQAYNVTKHDRHESFDLATFEHMTDAMGGLIILLSSQFYTHDFGPSDKVLALDEPRDGMESSICGYFRVRYPTDWPTDQQYDFEWQKLEKEADPFQEFDYYGI